MEKSGTSRRSAVKTSLGLVIGFHLHGMQKVMGATLEEKENFGSPHLANAFIKIGSDNTVTVVIHKLEMGQGVFTSLAQLLAEELECDWNQIRCEHSPVAPVYNHMFAPVQFVGGSSSVATSWVQLRKVGAMAREMLIQAAARRWKVPPKSCRAEKGVIYHPQKGSLAYGAVAASAQKEIPPDSLVLKDPSQFKVIGQSMPRIDAPVKSRGDAVYGMDLRVPGMVYGVLAQPPFGATLKTPVNLGPAKSVAGVVHAEVFGNLVAVVATSTYGAFKGREALELKWNLSSDPMTTTETQSQRFSQFFETPGTPVIKHPETLPNLKKAAKTIEAEFEFPWLAHASMEPLNCTVDFDGKKAKIWSAFQMPTSDRAAAAKALALAPEKIEMITTFAGGSFGRRASKTSEFVVNACLIAKSLRKPVKLVYSREDDMHGGFYRPYTKHRVKIALDAKAAPIAWHHQIVGQSVMLGSSFDAQVRKTGIDGGVVEGVQGTAYQLPAMSLDLHMPETPISSLWWRSVGHTHTAFVMETLLDQLAEAAQQDPLAFRRPLLSKNPRHLAVLDLLEKSSFWKEKPAAGRRFGLAIHESFNTVIGQVVEVSLGQDQKTPTIHRVDAAVHCGTVINPTNARSQVEGSIAFGLSACLFQELTFKQGQVKQRNYHDFPILKMSQMPQTRVFFVASQDPPTGLGEPGLPPIAPAVANGLYRLTQKRLTRLPLRLS